MVEERSWSKCSNLWYKPSRTKRSNEMKEKETEESSLPLVLSKNVKSVIMGENLCINRSKTEVKNIFKAIVL